MAARAKKKTATRKKAARKMAVAHKEQDKSIESWIWDATCSIRGAKDAPKYKDFIIPLIENRHERTPTWDAEKNSEGRWRKFSYEELVARDKTSLDVFWLKDKSLANLDNLPEPDELEEDFIENIESGLNSFREVLSGLQRKAG